MHSGWQQRLALRVMRSRMGKGCSRATWARMTDTGTTTVQNYELGKSVASVEYIIACVKLEGTDWSTWWSDVL